ncbi:hypothetical protein ACNPKZ_05685 [Shewanella algae]|uniref:hypothetical protein n=1 Tax=Shewanella TaxID=22 RepID=UPI0031F4A242
MNDSKLHFYCADSSIVTIDAFRRKSDNSERSVLETFSFLDRNLSLTLAIRGFGCLGYNKGNIGFVWGLIGCFAFIYTVVFELKAYL